ncbi:hypothetical protein QP437_10275, partial [Haemophilus sp. UMB1048]|uniref:hypothetical protein n=1 Tax=Haemophilus sp. UMB1048 TaxID=3046322 RepID=UPI0029713676|nr:hypothetical protein [Haemophilus sp. UMB1048]
MVYISARIASALSGASATATMQGAAAIGIGAAAYGVGKMAGGAKDKLEKNIDGWNAHDDGAKRATKGGALGYNAA